MCKIRLIYTILIASSLLILGCKDGNDTQAPEVSGSDQLTIEGTDSEDLFFSWNKAKDNSSSQGNLQYMLYTSEVPLPDLETILNSGTAITGWYTDLGSVSVALNSLDLSGTTYFNLLVKDKADNTKAYTQTAYIRTLYSETGSGYMAETIPSSGIESFYFDLDLSELTESGVTNPQVYYLFTNAGESGGGRPSLDDPSSVSFSSVRGSEPGASDSSVIQRIPAGWKPVHPVGLRDHPDLLNPEATPAIEPAGSGAVSRSTGEWQESRDMAEVSKEVFSADLEVGTVEATCRSVVSDGVITLNIWVADDCWETGGTKSFLVTREMVDAMAETFLTVGTDNDIYDWITGIFGEEWGHHDNSSYIGDNDEITILLYDIDNDGNGSEVPYDEVLGYYTAGFFWSRDNSLSGSSNQRIMFYLDAPVYACPDDPTTHPPESNWDVTSYYPRDQISTLAHEFQHMINFYQKNISRNTGQVNTWLNEMCSMMAEDLVSDKLGITGPRGITGDDYSDGDSGITDGRLPVFNYFDDDSLTDWQDRPEYGGLLMNYSSAYSFGAYIGRNYGGAELFREIIQSTFTDEDAVTKAVKAMDFDHSFEDLLAGWGKAVILSDMMIDEDGFRFNRTDPFESSTNDGTYSLGAINFYNYDFIEEDTQEVHTGPWYYGDPEGSTENSIFSEHEPASNIYYKDNVPADGKILRRFTQAPGIRVSLIVKE